MTPGAAFADALQIADVPGDCPRVGLAVSGGGDSTALMLLAADWAPGAGAELHVATIDHGLRPEAAREAEQVAALCREVGIPCQVLRWQGWDRRGNLQDAARRARKALLSGWAAERGIATILTGHTRDDQAETVLLRLARGSGVDGLAGIAPVTVENGLRWVRPLLGVGREELRDWLRARGAGWIDDPSNDDPRFDRVRARQMRDQLATLGLTAGRLADTAERMRAAAEVLARVTADHARRLVTEDRGDLLVDRDGLFAAPSDIVTRLMAAALQWVSGQGYRPRYAALKALLRDMDRGRGGTLHGCLVRPEGKGTIRIAREARAVAACVAAPGETWDGRWTVAGPFREGDEIRALGEALDGVPGWREAGMPRNSLMASPAVWRGGRVIAAPLAGYGTGWTLEPAKSRGDFAVAVNAH